jgi:hypothetical protein
MSTQPRPCYQVLSQYTEKGIKPIIAPTPVETEPQLFGISTPHKFSQKDYKLHQKYYLSPEKMTVSDTSYASYSSLCPSFRQSSNYVSVPFQSQVGFNEVGDRRWN